MFAFCPPRHSLLLLLAVGILAAAAAPAQAVPSLDARNSILVEYPVESGLHYTCIQDHHEPLQWYCFPNQPRLAYRLDKARKKVPDFNLLRYQFNRPEDPSTLLEGGILQFASVMELPGGEAIEYFKSKILLHPNLSANKELLKRLKRGPMTKDISIGSIAFKKADVAIYTVGGNEKTPGEFVGGGSRSSGVAPQFPSQKMPFTLELTRLGTDVYEALTTNAAGGIQVIYNVTYDGMTPDVGFKVTVDWSRISKHCSQDINSINEFSGNLFGAVNLEAAVGVKHKTVADYLESKDFIKIDVTHGENFTKEDAKLLMGPIIDAIQKKAFARDKLTPDQLTVVKETPAVADPVKRKEKDKADPEKKDSDDKKDSEKKDAATEQAISLQDTKDDAKKDDAKKDDAKKDEEKEPEKKDSGKVPKVLPTFRSETMLSFKKTLTEMKGSEVFEYKAREIKEYSTTLGGFLGLGEFVAEDKDILKRVIQNVGNSSAWSEAYFLLPEAPADLAQIGVTQVSLTVTVVDEKGLQAPGVFTTTATCNIVKDQPSEWKTDPAPKVKPGETPTPTTRLAFSLVTAKNVFEKKFGDAWREKLRFKVDQTVTRAKMSPSLKDTYYIPVFAGRKALNNARDNIKTVTIDPSGLLSLGEKSFLDRPGLFQVVALLSTKDQLPGGKEVERTYTQAIKNNTEPIYFMVQIPEGKSPNPYTLKLRFQDFTGKAFPSSSTYLSFSDLTSDFSITEDERALAESKKK